MNENYAQPDLPPGVEADVITGLLPAVVVACGAQPRRSDAAGLGRDPDAK